MAKSKRCNVQKLSAVIPRASLEQTKEELAHLRNLTNQSAEFSEEIGKMITKLRQVSAPADEPFIFTTVLDENEKLLRDVFRDCGDIEFRTFYIEKRKVLLIYLEDMTNTTSLEKNVIEALMNQSKSGNGTSQEKILMDMESIAQNIVGAAAVTVLKQASAAVETIMTGNALLLIDGIGDVLSIGTAQYVKRGVGGADNEHVLRGPNEAFNEALRDNIVLLRRRSRDTDLKLRILRIGERTRTSIAVLYVADLVKPGLVEEIEKRLSMIKVDKILTSSTIEEFLADHPWTPFPQAQTTERPDRMLAALYEGRVGILVDGTPASMIVPCTYNALMQNTDDYTIQPIISSSIRLMRGVAAFIAIYLPAIYVAIVSYHPGMLPTSMAITVAELRTRSPFPSFMEAVMMEILLEVFQEAVVRLPKKISGAASMIGALVIGTTIVQAGIINPLLVVVIATTALASYSMPSYNFSMALRWLRIPILILASVLGLYGVVLGILMVTIHLCSLRSFGESYLGGMFNVDLFSDWKDSVVRLPAKLLKTRTKEYGAQDQTRIGDGDG